MDIAEYLVSSYDKFDVLKFLLLYRSDCSFIQNEKTVKCENVKYRDWSMCIRDKMCT